MSIRCMMDGASNLGPVYTNPDSVVNALKSIRFGLLFTRILRKWVRNPHHFENACQSRLVQISARVNCESAYVLILPHDSACDSIDDLERKMEFLVVVTILLALIDFWSALYLLLFLLPPNLCIPFPSWPWIGELNVEVYVECTMYFLHHPSTGSPSCWKILPLLLLPNKMQLHFALLHVLITCADLTGSCVRLCVNRLNTDRFQCVY